MTYYPTSRIVEMTHAVQRHKIPKSDIPYLISYFEFAMRGFSDAEINTAFIDFMRMSSRMPDPEDIVYLIALSRGINPFMKTGLQ